MRFILHCTGQLLGFLLYLFLESLLCTGFDRPTFFGEASLCLIGIIVLTLVYMNVSLKFFWRWLLKTNSL